MDATTKYEMNSLLAEITDNWGTLQQILTFAIMLENLTAQQEAEYMCSWQGTKEGKVINQIKSTSYVMGRSVNKTIYS
jgi:hypothetical protein